MSINSVLFFIILTFDDTLNALNISFQILDDWFTNTKTV